MCKLVLDRGGFADFTSVSNIFIDEYMPKANGEFLKIYLYLLRLAGSGDLSMSLSTEKIADKFNMLESDVMRALNYWAEQGLISLSVNEHQELTGIKLESALSNRYFMKGQADSKADTQVTETADMSDHQTAETAAAPLPAKQKYTAKQITAFAEDERVSQLTFLAQTYLGKTLNTADINSILYMLDGLEFGVEFIEYMMETCISSGHKSLSYIEKQAVLYYKKGISTAEDAKADEKLRRAISKSIYKVFGLAPKAPVKRDISFITKWTDEYGFSDELIIEACNRTMARTHTGSFEYTDGILTNWYQHNAKSMDAIVALDDAHTEEQSKAFETRKPAATRSKKTKSFEERSYDYDALEKKLRTTQNKKIKALLANQKED